MTKWDSGQLWLKAKTYAERANEFPHDSDKFPLWSALSLELLARASLTSIHPVLNADPRNDVSILYGCGFEVPGQPKSIPVHSVYLRLEKTVPGFGKAQREVCDFLALLRNQELHSAELPFVNLKESRWLPRYYEACKILCNFTHKALEDLFGNEIAATAETLINGLAKETEGEVRSRIAKHSAYFSDKPEAERTKLINEVKIALLRPAPGTKNEPCPSCTVEGILTGNLIKELPPVYEGDSLFIDQEYLAIRFECFACGLTLRNYEEVSVAGIEPRFTGLRETDLHELYEPDFSEEYDNM